MAASNTPRAKTERLMNLTMCLLSTRRALPKARIRRMVEGYHDQSDEAFDRMFERDKVELRALGIPLVTEELDGLFEDEPGYRIDQRDYALPQIELTADERAVVGLASRMWSHAAMAPAAATAWRKIAANDSEGDGAGDDPFSGIEPTVGGSEPAFPALQEAATGGRSVRFGYRTARGGEPVQRHVDPWALTSWRGRWYLSGHDHDRGESRVFRLSRVVSDVKDAGPLTVTAPEDFDPRQAIADLAGPADGEQTATVRVRAGAGHDLRRRAVDVVPGEGWDELTLTYGPRHTLADELASYGPDVVALAPDDLVGAVRDRLDGVLASLEVSR